VSRFYATEHGHDPLDTSIYNVYTLAVDRHVELDSLQFVWNEAKAAVNLAKHGVRFEAACEVFFDPLLRVTDAMIESESRQTVIGETRLGRLLFVVHAEIEDDVIRIISARAATARERNEYEDYA
jgi:hypothetical protein